jgi:hypothetical protein
MKKTQSELESRVIVGAHGVAAEEDHLVMGKVVGIGVGSLIIFLVGILWAWRIQVRTMADILGEDMVAAPRPADMGQYEVGIVNQRLFEQDWHAVEKLGGQHQALGAGWGDQPGVKAHPNLNEAMERVINEARNPPPTPPPPAPPEAPAPGTPASPRQ